MTLTVRIPVLLLGLWLVLPAALAAPLANQLRNHASPYLAMHGADPVAWQDWNHAVMERARREGKLVYLSVGYFSCHWCHVMQRESYRNPDIARFLNEHVIPVKIDRELEPALDRRLIEFAEKTRGQGGWPLNVFLTPDGHPLYAVLYQPPAEFLDGIKKLQTLWRQDPARLRQLARQEAVKAEGPGAPRIDARQVRAYAAKAVTGALSIADGVHGGFGEQSKFPSVPPLELLLGEYRRTPGEELGAFLTRTLEQMAGLGLYDHVGGGFFRYTVDPGWKTPHFEKMLYDNALLARLYLRAARVFGRSDFVRVARETLDFMARELAGTEGALIASLSAVDGKGVEGGYYLWSKADLEKLLSPEVRELYVRVHGMTDAAPFDAGYLPLRVAAVADIAKQLGTDPDDAQQRLARARARLLEARAARIVPRDTKLLAGWNGLALAAFAEAAAQLKEPRYRSAAEGIRDYLANRLWDGKALKRAVADNRALGAVSLEDYAYVAEGLMAWARLTGRSDDCRLAQAVAEAGWARHHGRQGWRLSANGPIGAEGGQDLIADGPMPAPSAVLARASLEIAGCAGNGTLRERALSALNSGHKILGEDPFWYASHIEAMHAAIGMDAVPNDAPKADPGATVGGAGGSVKKDGGG
jgi:uncharacterized protein YyaL (SSP411 family)